MPPFSAHGALSRLKLAQAGITAGVQDAGMRAMEEIQISHAAQGQVFQALCALYLLIFDVAYNGCRNWRSRRMVNSRTVWSHVTDSTCFALRVIRSGELCFLGSRFRSNPYESRI